MIGLDDEGRNQRECVPAEGTEKTMDRETVDFGQRDEAACVVAMPMQKRGTCSVTANPILG
ncbi:MAG: hypothetical protein A3J74_05570 [Elusimicrobia bacterium RIFCSPHIGHO2_02_FULL_57_9]|nr:MAG: hypothetical protein A3J74_05570 [Elusimicrobia bacterium RIFCSPHIGHO2_02_FULL_57_9]